MLKLFMMTSYVVSAGPYDPPRGPNIAEVRARAPRGKCETRRGLSFRKVLDSASPSRKVFAALAPPRSVLGEGAELEAVGADADVGGRHDSERAKRKPANLMADGLS